MRSESGLLQVGLKSEKSKWSQNFLTWRQKFPDMTSSSIFFNVAVFLLSCLITGPSLISISPLVLESWQFSFITGLTRNLEIGNSPVLILPSIWRLGWVREIKFDTNFFNEKLLNAVKCQSHIQLLTFLIHKGKTKGKKLLPPTYQDLGKKVNCKQSI